MSKNCTSGIPCGRTCISSLYTCATPISAGLPTCYAGLPCGRTCIHAAYNCAVHPQQPPQPQVIDLTGDNDVIDLTDPDVIDLTGDPDVTGDDPAPPQVVSLNLSVKIVTGYTVRWNGRDYGQPLSLQSTVNIVSEVNRIFSQAGIQFNMIENKYINAIVPSDPSSLEGHIRNIHRLYRLRDGNTNAINVWFVPVVPEFGVLGFCTVIRAGGVGGAPLNGRFVTMSSDRDSLDVTLAHELGHALSLGHHPSEQNLMHEAYIPGDPQEELSSAQIQQLNAEAQRILNGSTHYFLNSSSSLFNQVFSAPTKSGGASQPADDSEIVEYIV